MSGFDPERAFRMAEPPKVIPPFGKRTQSWRHSQSGLRTASYDLRPCRVILPYTEAGVVSNKGS